MKQNSKYTFILKSFIYISNQEPSGVLCFVEREKNGPHKNSIAITPHNVPPTCQDVCAEIFND